jgi:O-antigen ligase
MTIVSGFLAFLFLYQNVSTWLKLLVVWCFVSCFLSSAPFISFTMFWSVIVCAYYYSLCMRIKDFTPVKRAIQAIFFLIVVLIIAQLSGKDTLLNFKESAPDILHGKVTPVLGLIGNKMMASSFVCVLSPFLIITPLNWILLILVSFISWSSGAVLSVFAGLVVYMWQFKRLRNLIVTAAVIVPLVFAYNTGKIKTFQSKAGRRLVYIKTFELSLKRPMGYGIGTYKVLFPALCGKEIRDQQPGRAWNTTHNDYLQILFEGGFIGLFLLLGWIISILRKVKDPVMLSGLTILAVNMTCHFPMRLVQSAFVILMFLAYLSKGESYGRC